MERGKELAEHYEVVDYLYKAFLMPHDADDYVRDGVETDIPSVLRYDGVVIATTALEMGYFKAR